MSAPGREVVLAPGREKSLEKRHPWIFSGAVHSVGKDLRDGDVVDVVDTDGKFRARGILNRKSQILVRVLSFSSEDTVDDAFLSARVKQAVSRRHGAVTRLVHAESDRLPGLVADRYGDFAVVQLSSLGLDLRRDVLVRALAEKTGVRGVFERSDVDGRKKEGLEDRVGLAFGEAPPELLQVPERTHDGRTVTLLVDVRRGHKTGAYLDQADNRRAIARRANGARVLNAFSFAGAFGLHAAAAGAAEVVNVDSSPEALALSERTAAENGVAEKIRHVRADVFEEFRRLRAAGETFDVIVVDPPKLAHSPSHVDRAARAYKDLARLAFHLARPGGIVACFSCSGAVTPTLFQQIVWSGSLEAQREAQIVERLSQPEDHPVLLTFPEGEYLKGLVCRVL
ncbi:MAG TPA: class I SAM-dependent rRNA methyltransferase [Polyangiaceae bacterium]|nr:class I SAM-dependent rRNA methyltransferase [Polyangiaceae bacterium]